jgi:hypothetical protein
MNRIPGESAKKSGLKHRQAKAANYRAEHSVAEL